MWIFIRPRWVWTSHYAVSVATEIPVLVFRQGIRRLNINSWYPFKIQAMKLDGLEDDEYRNYFSKVVQFCGYNRTMENTEWLCMYIPTEALSLVTLHSKAMRNHLPKYVRLFTLLVSVNVPMIYTGCNTTTCYGDRRLYCMACVIKLSSA